MAQAKELNARIDRASQIFRSTIRGFGDPQQEPLAEVREVVIGPKIKVGVKSMTAQTRAVDVDGEIVFIERGMGQPIELADAQKILSRSRRARLTRTMNSEINRLTTKFTNASKS